MLARLFAPPNDVCYSFPTMAITDSAKKAIRSSARKRVFNLARKDTMNGDIKRLKRLLKDGKTQEAVALFPKVQQAIDKATKTNLIKKNTSSRKKSRLSALMKKVVAK